MSQFARLLEKNPLLASVLDQHYDAILLLDPQDLVCVYHNQPATNLFNLPESLGGPFALHRLFIDGLSENRFRSVLKLGGADHFLLDRFSLRRFPDQAVVCGIKGKSLSIDGEVWLFCTFRDISERIRMEEREKAIQAQLIQANKMTSLGTMASGVAHEINNPNNYILSNAQMVNDIWTDLSHYLCDLENLDHDTVVGGLDFDEALGLVPQLLSGIVEGSGRINAIVSRMKQYARPVQQDLWESVSLNQVVRFAITMLEREIGKRTERFTFEPDESLPPIQGYHAQLEQVMINLIQNALQALPDPSAGVEVISCREAEWAVVSVRDEGVGIAESAKTRIFEPFYTTKQQIGGTGLGLYISYGIIREHNGDLSVTSVEGEGTTMTLRFPITHSQEKDTEEA